MSRRDVDRTDRLDRRLLVCTLLTNSGAAFVWNVVANRRRPLIVYYHNVHAGSDDLSWCGEPSLSMPVELFRQQMDFVSRRYAIVSLEEAVAMPSRKSLAITFDDGYAGVYDNAFPILREYGMPATVFLVTDFLGSSIPLWWDQLIHNLRAFRSRNAGERHRLADGLPERWPMLLDSDCPEVEVLTEYKLVGDALRSRIDLVLTPDGRPPWAHSQQVFLSRSQIAEMQAGDISFGAHTRSHPLLHWLEEPALYDEVAGSKAAVESLTGRPPCWFAYPDGTFDEHDRRLVERLGFAGALQSFRRPDLGGRFAVPRVGLSAASTTRRDGSFAIPKFQCLLAGISKRRLRGAFR